MLKICCLALFSDLHFSLLSSPAVFQFPETLALVVLQRSQLRLSKALSGLLLKSTDTSGVN